MALSEGNFGKAWDDYANKILPRNASSVQVVETRRAFYAGGISLWSAIMSSLTPEHEPTDDDLRMIAALQAEFDAYARDLAEGRA